MLVRSGSSTLCASTNEELGTLADNNPLTLQSVIVDKDLWPTVLFSPRQFELRHHSVCRAPIPQLLDDLKSSVPTNHVESSG